MQLNNEFILDASPAAVWAGLTNPEVAVACMPGATLTEKIGDHGFKATVSLKVGPVKLQFAGEGSLGNLSADGSYGEMLARGSDGKGRGGFKTEMKFHLEPHESATRVRVETDLTLSGSVAQYGRGAGIVKEVASQLTEQFTSNLQHRVKTEAPASTAGVAPAEPAAPAAHDNHPAAQTVQPASGPIKLPSLVLSALLRWLKSMFQKKP